MSIPAVGLQSTLPPLSILSSFSLSPQVGYSAGKDLRHLPFLSRLFLAFIDSVAAMLVHILFTTLLAALLAVAAPLQRRNGVQLAVLTDQVPNEGLTAAEISMLDEVRKEAAVALREAREVLNRPNFEQNALFHAFLNREACSDSCVLLLADIFLSQSDADLATQKDTYDKLLATTSQPLLHINAESQDPNHMTIKKGGPKGTSKAR
jgi:hypothetical protein